MVYKMHTQWLGVIHWTPGGHRSFLKITFLLKILEKKNNLLRFFQKKVTETPILAPFTCMQNLQKLLLAEIIL